MGLIFCSQTVIAGTKAPVGFGKVIPLRKKCEENKKTMLEHLVDGGLNVLSKQT